MVQLNGQRPDARFKQGKIVTQPPFQPPTSYPPSVPYQPESLPPRPTALTVVAVIGIVLASLGIICNGFSGVSSALAAAGITPLAANQPQLPRWVNVIGSADAFISLFIDITWIIVCIGLLRLSLWARKAAVTLACVHLVWLVVTAVFNFGVVAPHTKELLEQQLASQPGPASGPSAATMGTIAAASVYFGIGLGLLFGLILPVMMLATMTRQSMKDLFAATPAMP
jgi:hypothetical protein